MFDAIEFDTEILEDGIIRIPEKYRKQIGSASKAHVRIPTNGDTPFDAIDYYLENPIIIPGVKAPTREEIYEGR